MVEEKVEVRVGVGCEFCERIYEVKDQEFDAAKETHEAHCREAIWRRAVDRQDQYFLDMLALLTEIRDFVKQQGRD